MSYALGIDLGTTFTAAAVSRNGRVEIVGMGNHASSIPSAVLLREDGELLVGDAATRRGQQEPARLAREFKRRLGDATPIILGHTPYSSERLMAAVVRHVVDTVTERQGGAPSAVTIAHPANWGPYKRELLEQAATVAGLSGARFVSEPEAAAVHFAAGERVEEGGIIAVYDLGGGTFDAAVLRRVGARFVTMAEPQGIERLGGIDFDESVLSHVRATVGGALAELDGSDPVVRSGMIRLRADCIAAKEALSDDSEAVIPVMLPGLQTQVRLTRPEFENMIRPVLRETIDMLRRAIQGAGMAPADLSAVVLAGGSSRIPLVAEMVSETLGRPVAVDAHPKDTVALGAARLASGSEHSKASPAPSTLSAAPPATVPVASVPATVRPIAVAPPAPAATRTNPARRSAGPPDSTRPHPAETPAPPPRRGRRIEIMIASVIVLVAIGAGMLMILGGTEKDASPPVGTGTENSVAISDTQDVEDPVDVADTAGAEQPIETDGAAGDPDTAGAEQPNETDGAAGSGGTEAGTAPVIHRCTSENGRCVFITDISTDGDAVVAEYITFGYDPELDGGRQSRHVHFYFDTLPIDQAGIPAPPNWVAYDVDENGELIYRFPRSSIAGGASKLCASVANVNHGLDDHLQSCVALP